MSLRECDEVEESVMKLRKVCDEVKDRVCDKVKDRV
jgi:hypothetical protein